MSKYKAPAYRASSFSCPHCGALANQSWSDIYLNLAKDEDFIEVEGYLISLCYSCKDIALWKGNRAYTIPKLIYPQAVEGELLDPNPDMEEDIRIDFIEARSILHLSPRGATAILRLCLQKLCIQLGQKGKNINDDIAALVKKGLDPKIQKALDIVRVIGNNAVHPGEIDLKDNSQTALTLLSLINLIAEVMISQPKHIQTLYDSLPAGAIQAIEKRDA